MKCTKLIFAFPKYQSRVASHLIIAIENREETGRMASKERLMEHCMRRNRDFSGRFQRTAAICAALKGLVLAILSSLIAVYFAFFVLSTGVLMERVL